jgi:tannase/feruloyl esterase
MSMTRSASVTTVSVLLVLGALIPGVAWAVLPNCTAGAIAALDVPNVTVTSVVDVPTSASGPEFCQVRGSVTTTGFDAPDGSAGFEVRMPALWNQKVLFFGVGGLGGATFADIAVTPTDFIGAVTKGYALAITDTGHRAGNTDASWAVSAPGVADRARVVDYYFRATHDVTVAAKRLVRGFYGTGPERAYFDGCSNGGRQALMEATRFPDDYDGIIAGAPFMDLRTIIAGVKQQKVQLQSVDAYIPFTKLALIDAAVYKSCDAADGVVDNLIQNPAACSFDPRTLVTPTCTAADPTCLTPQQAVTLASYITATRDKEGRLVYPGAAISDLGGTGGAGLWTTGFVPPSDFTAAEPWGDSGFSPAPVAWQFVDHITQFIVERDPHFNTRTFDVSLAGVVGEEALRLFDRRTEAADADRPGDLEAFVKMGKKLIMYHGFSDPALPPFRTVRFYEDLAREVDGFGRAQDSVRLFMVPGLQHCVGGPGPNTFDTLSALEQWVEHGIGPDGIVAAKFPQDNPAKPPQRTMPLCKFPEQARYDGTGDVTHATSWTCSANDTRLLDVGPNGAQAGLGRVRDRERDAGDVGD